MSELNFYSDRHDKRYSSVQEELTISIEGGRMGGKGRDALEALSL